MLNFARGLSIRTTLTGVVGATALLLVATSGASLWEGWQEYRTARHIEAVSGVDKLVFQAMQALRNDRSSLNRALIDSEPSNEDVVKDLASTKAAAEPALAAALDAIAAGDLPDRDQWLSKLKAGADQFQAKRAAAEAAFALPKAQRDDAVRKDYYAYAGTFVNQLGDASAAFAGSIRSADPVIDQLLTARDLIWTVRDTDSRYRRTIEDALMAGGITRENREFGIDLRAQMTASWETLQGVLDADATPADIAAAAAEIKRVYFADFAPKRDEIFEAVNSDQKPAMTSKEWRALSKPPSDLLKAMVTLVVDGAQKHAAERTSAVSLGLMRDAALMLAALVISVFGFAIVSRRVARPLTSLTNAMSALAKGDTATAIPATDRRDEIGAMAAAVLVFKDNALERQRLEAEQQADLEAKQQRAKAVEQLIGSFDSKITGVLQSVTAAANQLNGTANEMSGAAAESAAKATAVAAASEQASANVKTVAASTDELAKSTQEIGQQATLSQNIARQAVSEAERTNTTVAGLVETAAKVGEVVELINSIAAQTNLLALNATIEAARAGEAGKGFAVVASEVKSLANQTAKATEQISGQIQAMQSVSGDAAEAIKSIGGTIKRVDEIAAAIAAAVEEQNAATSEIAGNVQQAAQGTEEVSGNIVQVNEATSRTGSSAQQVLSASQELSRQAEAMRGMVLSFLSEIRAA
jgi:methyl-accepting chemotaxis protein